MKRITSEHIVQALFVVLLLLLFRLSLVLECFPLSVVGEWLIR